MSATMSPEHLVMECLAALSRRGIAIPPLNHMSASVHAADLMLRSFGLVPTEPAPAAELPAAPDATAQFPRVPLPPPPATDLRIVTNGVRRDNEIGAGGDGSRSLFLRGTARVPS